MDIRVAYRDVAMILEEAVERADLPAPFREMLRIPLRQPGKTLGGADQPRWPALVLASAAAAGGERHSAALVAAAMELFMAAADVFDELEDGDFSPLVDAVGVPLAINAASTLISLAHEVLARLDQFDVSLERIPAFTHTLARGALIAAGGQCRDLMAEHRQDVTAEDALMTARAKAGALGATACRLGALLGTEKDELLTLYDELGQHIGTIGQLSNDLDDAISSEGKSDRSRAKATLPLLFARENVRSQTMMTDNEAGGAHFAWVVLEVERQGAYRVLERLSDQGQQVDHFRELLG